eukprot:CAMPEP_0201878506 /NCGR_PEP_ID=MMETSP0902-20130614/9651_1 /ASSEMBLY_ACC=CAM_ASM_000551 /TAXON_ID=420261 /ORGANISM="Thalassiosira antarctica, Strain CCMP982" /LENGTH=130 /DNA_ID=CAMNT_0048406165 /DNA_START=279 /DNA_END=669 /DNA_ORIENTATION=+
MASRDTKIIWIFSSRAAARIAFVQKTATTSRQYRDEPLINTSGGSGGGIVVEIEGSTIAVRQPLAAELDTGSTSDTNGNTNRQARKVRMARSSRMVRGQTAAAVESSSSADGADAIDGLHEADEKVFRAW